MAFFKLTRKPSKKLIPIINLDTHIDFAPPSKVFVFGKSKELRYQEYLDNFYVNNPVWVSTLLRSPFLDAHYLGEMAVVCKRYPWAELVFIQFLQRIQKTLYMTFNLEMTDEEKTLELDFCFSITP